MVIYYEIENVRILSDSEVKAEEEGEAGDDDERPKGQSVWPPK